MYLMVNVLQQNFLQTTLSAEITISRERYLGSETRQVIIVTQIVIRSERLVGDKFPVRDSL